MLIAVVVALALLVVVLLALALRRGRIELPRHRKRRILPGGGPVPDDLSKDAYTDDQRFLM